MPVEHYNHVAYTSSAVYRTSDAKRHPGYIGINLDKRHPCVQGEVSITCYFERRQTTM